ncbi:hypothetical protein MB901379_04710 [Mycobacterium basiliense]|uniref:Uncharacterized protein n=1 Tax=Mycobacterium basiliense TaxID=2094119 RepID=A0A3S4FRF7_9MYCO|nr:hypothetical protein MB901379_04710 [Mycobacterium basiliense]
MTGTYKVAVGTAWSTPHRRRQEIWYAIALPATGMRAVSAMRLIRGAEPGIVDTLPIPFTAPIGARHPQRDGEPAC